MASKKSVAVSKRAVAKKAGPAKSAAMVKKPPPAGKVVPARKLAPVRKSAPASKPPTAAQALLVAQEAAAAAQRAARAAGKAAVAAERAAAAAEKAAACKQAASRSGEGAPPHQWQEVDSFESREAGPGIKLRSGEWVSFATLLANSGSMRFLYAAAPAGAPEALSAEQLLLLSSHMNAIKQYFQITSICQSGDCDP